MNRAQPSGVTIHRIVYDPVPWDAIVARHPEAEVFHGSGWLDYLQATQGAEPVIAEVRDSGRPVGYFVGGIVRRYGVRILGSPLRGWATMHMGFLLEPGFDRRAAAGALPGFAFRKLGCVHIELADKGLGPEQMAGSAYVIEVGRTFVVDLTQSEEAILAGMRSTTRNYIRQASRKGLTAEVATDDAFADEYYLQLIEVFARQGLSTTYSVDRVRKLIEALEPSAGVLRMRVRSPEGRSIATAITVGRNDTAVLWGAAFERAYANLHPNELLHWEEMRYWRSKGMAHYDMGGGGDYKAKFGGVEVPSYWLHQSRFRIFRLGRSAVRRVFRLRQIAKGRLARSPDDRRLDGATDAAVPEASEG